MPSIAEIRQQYPQYNDMTDTDLADALHSKFYSDLPKEQVYQSLGIKAAAPEAPKDSSADLKRGIGMALRAPVEGLSTPANIVADGVATLVNNYNKVMRPAQKSLVQSIFGDKFASLMADSDPQVPMLSEVQQKGLNNLGAPLPETGVEKALYGGVKALSGGLATNVVAAPFRAAQGMMTTTPAQVTSLAVGGATAPVAHDTIKEVTGSDIAATAGALGLSTLLGAAAGKGVEAGVDAVGRRQLLTMEEVRQRAQQHYANLDNSGVTLNSNWVRAALNGAERTLRNERYDPQLHPEVRRTLEVMNEVVNNSGGTMRIGQLDDLRKRALDLRASTDRNTQRLGGELVDEIDNFFNNLPQAAIRVGSQADARQVSQEVALARRDWRNLSRAETIEEAMRRADIKSDRPTAAQSEQLRQELISLQANQKKIRLFNENERDALREITRDGSATKVATWLAGFNPQRAGLRATGTFTGAVAAGAGGQTGTSAALAALTAAGWSADKILTLTKNAAGRRLIQDIANGTVRPPPPPEFTRGLFGGVAGMPASEPQE